MDKSSFNFEEERLHFLNVFPLIKQDILNELPKMGLPNNIINYISTLLNSPTITGGKMIKGLGFLYSFDYLNNINNNINNNNKNNNNNDNDNNNSNNNNNLKLTKFEARIIGWCIEFISFFLIADDIMDGGLTRRGGVCWYLNPSPFNPSEHKVGLLAINDSLLLESFLFLILKKYFKYSPYYLDILEIVRVSIINSSMGQLLDTSFLHQKRGDFTNFDLE
ncbi:hypothetical protein ACTA71_007332 [Dictyostelium dimigraforme]